MTWLDRFAGLADLPADAARALQSRSRTVRLPPGARVFEPGQRAENMLLLLSGSVRVQQISVAIPRSVFDELTGSSPVFRSFVFRTYSRRIADLFGLIDDIVFQRMDVRLAEHLLALEKDSHIATTHQALATDLGTAREVISRTLGEFQRRGWVALGRGDIRITDRAGLERLSRPMI